MRNQRKLPPGHGRIGRMREPQFEVRQGKKSGNPFGPFHRANRIVAEAIGKSRRFPFTWIGEPIKIKVIEV